jgi:hypothetical protein
MYIYIHIYINISILNTYLCIYIYIWHDIYTPRSKTRYLSRRGVSRLYIYKYIYIYVYCDRCRFTYIFTCIYIKHICICIHTCIWHDVYPFRSKSRYLSRRGVSRLYIYIYIYIYTYIVIDRDLYIYVYMHVSILCMYIHIYIWHDIYTPL